MGNPIHVFTVCGSGRNVGQDAQMQSQVLSLLRFAGVECISNRYQWILLMCDLMVSR